MALSTEAGGSGGTAGEDPAPAVRWSREGAVLEVEVQPGSRRPGALEYDAWRKRLRVPVGERAERGKANEALLELLSGLLGLHASRMAIVSGLKQRHKSVLVMDITAEELLRRLREAVKGG